MDTSTLERDILAELDRLHARLIAVGSGLDGDDLDRVPAPGANSIAVLLAHVTGSELAWLHRAAGRSFQRDRDAEFRTSGRPGSELIALVERCTADAPALVREAVAYGLGQERGLPDGRTATVGFCLLHSLAHTAEHLAHAELTRQVLAGR